MTDQVDFYILGAADGVAKLKYACRIAEKAYSHGMRVYLHTENPAQSEQLDKLLWTFSQGSFVPHTIANNATENWQHFPVQLGDILDPVVNEGDDDNSADLLICLTRDIPQAHTRFRRIADLVSSEASEKASARSRFRYYREQGIEPDSHLID